MRKKVFDGIKVADFSWVAVGPSSTRYLADHGATVVRIESHTRPETGRFMTPFAGNEPGINRSMFAGRYNANKYGVSIDLNHPRGRELAWKLIMWADIMTESFSPGIVERWELDYESVSKVRPDIIYLSTSMQGRGGPHSSYRGYGSLMSCLAGFGETTGFANAEPIPPYGAYNDYICPRFNATAIIAALEYRRRTGKGQLIEQSQFETSLHFLAPFILDYNVNGRVARRMGNSHPYAAPHGIYSCQGDDRWVAIAVCTDEEWKSFCQAIGEPEWTKESRFSTVLGRKKNENELDELVGIWTNNYTAMDIEIMMQAAGVSAHMVEKCSDVFEDPQIHHRNYFVRLNHREMGKPAYEQQACYILSKTPRKLAMPSPCLGEHNEYVFKELLGLSDDEIAEHIIGGSITSHVP